MHRFLLSRFGGDGDRVAQALQSHFGLAPSSGWSQRDVQRHLPENVTLQAIPAALAKAGDGLGMGWGWVGDGLGGRRGAWDGESYGVGELLMGKASISRVIEADSRLKPIGRGGLG